MKQHTVAAQEMAEQRWVPEEANPKSHASRCCQELLHVSLPEFAGDQVTILQVSNYAALCMVQKPFLLSCQAMHTENE